MGVRMTATDAIEIAPQIWSFSMAPHLVMHLGKPSHSVGDRSIIIFNDWDYDAEKRYLNFEIEAATAVNIGTTTSVIGVAGSVIAPHNMPDVDANLNTFGPGDIDFLNLTKNEMSHDMAVVAEKLLTAVRHRSPGNLKRGQSRNFSETPDNFWYVIVQPRINELSITVRGPVEHFKPVANLTIKDDRGNTRFKVQGIQDIEAATELIFHAIRKL